MKANLSNYLTSQKQIIKKLVTDLSKEFKYVSILGSDTIGNTYSVSKRSSSVGDSNWSERGFVIRVYNGYNYSEYSFNTLSDLEFIKKRIKEISINDISILQKKGINLIEFPLIVEEEIKEDFYSEFEQNPFEVSSEEKLKRMTEVMNEGLKKSEFFIDFRVNFEEVKISKIFVSSKKDLAQSILYTNMSLLAIARKDGNVKYDFEGFSGVEGYEIFDQAKDKINIVSKSVLSLLDAKRIIPGEYEIICDPSVSGLIAHEAFGHGVEMDMFVKNRAKGQEFIGKAVASNKVNMRDGAKSAIEVGTYLFDDEGAGCPIDLSCSLNFNIINSPVSIIRYFTQL